LLALTQQAAEAVETIVSQPELPDSAVLRITATATSDNGARPAHELELAIVEEPAEEDIVVEEVPISVDPDALDFLDDKVLDAEVAEGDVQFSLFRQPGASSANGAGPLV
jgi:Fe-S cluster assembly iron-binding protein IscA